jgi:hypothetical protein
MDVVCGTISADPSQLTHQTKLNVKNIGLLSTVILGQELAFHSLQLPRRPLRRIGREDCRGGLIRGVLVRICSRFGLAGLFEF